MYVNVTSVFWAVWVCDNITQLPFKSVALMLVLLDHMPWLQGHISAVSAAGECGSLSAVWWGVCSPLHPDDLIITLMTMSTLPRASMLCPSVSMWFCLAWRPLTLPFSNTHSALNTCMTSVMCRLNAHCILHVLSPHCNLTSRDFCLFILELYASYFSVVVSAKCES